MKPPVVVQPLRVLTKRAGKARTTDFADAATAWACFAQALRDGFAAYIFERDRRDALVLKAYMAATR
jgi:hypothetical protein